MLAFLSENGVISTEPTDDERYRANVPYGTFHAMGQDKNYSTYRAEEAASPPRLRRAVPELRREHVRVRTAGQPPRRDRRGAREVRHRAGHIAPQGTVSGLGQDAAG